MYFLLQFKEHIKVTLFSYVFPTCGIFFLVEFLFKETPRNGAPARGKIHSIERNLILRCFLCVKYI